jgi:hypothetical protein
MSTAENPFAGQGAVLLDIGDDVGALVVTMPGAMVDTEVEIRPVGVAHSHPHGGHVHGHDHPHHDSHHEEDGHLAHVAVVERPGAGGTVPSLVFGELTAGRYDLFEKGHPDQVVMTVAVDGGQVTAAAWPV